MERVAADPWARKRVMFDILNEPDARFMHVSSASSSWNAMRPNIPVPDLGSKLQSTREQIRRLLLGVRPSTR
jgi:hypothetical protein